MLSTHLRCLELRTLEVTRHQVHALAHVPESCHVVMLHLAHWQTAPAYAKAAAATLIFLQLGTLVSTLAARVWHPALEVTIQMFGSLL